MTQSAYAAGDVAILRPNGGVVKLRNRQWTQIPAGFSCEVLDLQECTGAIELPPGLQVYELLLQGTQIETLPDDLQVEMAIHLTNCRELHSLPAGLTTGTLMLAGCSSLTSLPEGLDVWFLDMSGCWGFQHWPEQAHIRAGNLNLRGCTAIGSLPAYLGPLASLNVRDCSLLTEIPDGLKITGWIDIAQSGLAGLKQKPASLANVEARWQGVRIDDRIWTHPDSITLQEILGEENAEARRVLIDRFGQSRFMAEANAEILDEDQDAGGVRKLLRVPLPEDEPLVTLSCRCPSTGRDYFLRVPPTMQSCRHAAAWMAGYDNPDDYDPEIET
ncbi:DUF6745 domain-containing protein [Blastopirellula marina]|uniref:SWIM-type domain-containing protein n=1 Tax=Blastopirellula marina TaxID=124 RepID=A0A2S8GFE9_9BACT|nr:hypothetical protein [Blastopirellula marina]PQO43187.1 hypothetical protein C5Y93_26150 [Blastopirellula marina]